MKIRSLTTTFFAALLCASSLSAQKLRDVNDDVYYDGVTTLEVTASKNTLQNNGSQNVEDKTTPYYSDEYVTDEVNYTAQMNRFHNPSGMGYYSPYNYGAGWDDPWYWNSANSSWGFNNGWGNNYNNNCCNNGWGNSSYNNGWGNNNSWGNNNGWGNNNRWGSYYYNPYSAYNSYNSYNSGWGNNNNNWASYDPSTNTRPASSTRVTRTSDGNAGTSRNINNNSYTAPSTNSNSSGNNATNNGNTSNSGTNSNGRRTYNTTQTERSTETKSTPRQSSGSFNTSKPSNNTSSGRRSGR